MVLGLIFLKYISDSFEEKHAQLVEEQEKATQTVLEQAEGLAYDWAA